nr:vinorine synthase-like [Ipomoea batatas]
MKLSIVSKELIKPSIPTPPENQGYNLSFLDEPTPHFYIPLVLYYHNHTHTNQSEILSRLKSSLSKTLTKFYPLAGRNKGQTLVNCSDEGVCFVVARGEGMIEEMIGSAEGKESEKLVPYGKGDGIVAKTEELLGVQVSLFSCGGVAIGVCISHRVADVCSLCAFLQGWAACACGDKIKVSPVFNGSSLFPARGTPDFKPPEICSALQPPPEPLATKRFVFSASAIDEMKAKHTKTTNTNTTPASRVEVVSALLWKRCMASKEHKNGAVSANMFPVNLRRRMAPPLPEYSFGNLYQTASAVADWEEDWPGLVKKLRAASERIDGSYVTKLRGGNGFEVLKENFRQIGRLMAERNVVVFRFTSWCGFPVYEMDFGWGNPGWVSTPGFGSIDTVILLDSRYPGGVEAWVTMADQDMSRLEQDSELHSFTC